VANIVLFHSSLGLRRAVLADADRLRARGHHVAVPDLLDGQCFADTRSAQAFLAKLGREQVRARALHAVDRLPPGQVYAGYSLGGGLAQWLLEIRGDASGGIFISNGNPPAATWHDVPVQVHAARSDTWIDERALDLLAQAGAEVFRYAGGHLFADTDLADHHAGSTSRMWEEIDAFLARLETGKDDAPE
jgi:dienelactone hydrolase